MVNQPHRRRRGKRGAPAEKHVTRKIRPGVDPRLRPVFEQIGVPEKTPFMPDDFQMEALNASVENDVLVTAPTGSGKTWIAEKAIERLRGQGLNAWYASPLKALSNSIYNHFCRIFEPRNVGILTGDRKENTDAPVIVGTTEILRNQLYDAMYSGKDMQTDFVVLDEAHFLGDEDRGVVWEEVMIYLPERIPLLLLSATIGNAAQIAGWIESLRGKPCRVVSAEKRPVPLYPLFFHPSGTLMPLMHEDRKQDKPVLNKHVAACIQNRGVNPMAPPGRLPPMGDIIRVLGRYNLLPAIFFLKSRMDCDKALELCTEESLLNNPERKDRLRERIAGLTEHYPHLANHRQRWHLEQLAVGAHHSGQLPAWKIVIESLMSAGLLDAVFATSTVAAGVNFPARTVVIFNSDRFNGKDFIPLTASEFLQATGRAGRRGMDNIGFAVFVPGKFMDVRMAARLTHSPPSHVFSQIHINFSMVLNLLLSHTPPEIEVLLEKSFATYQLAHSSEPRKKAMGFMNADNRYLWRDFNLHLEFLKSYDYVNDADRLTEDGAWASQLRIDHPLMVAECFRMHLFPEKEPAFLAGLMACFVSERESEDDEANRDLIPHELYAAFLNIRKRLRPFCRHLDSSGFETKEIFLTPVIALFKWATGHAWEDVVALSGTAEGDLARLIIRTADHLRHVENLVKVFPDLAWSASTAIRLILKEPVSSYYESF